MAASGFTPIQLYHSTTTAEVPSAGNLIDGELAINTADGKLFYKDPSGIVQEVLNTEIASTIQITPSSTPAAFKVPFANTTISVSGNYPLLQDSSAEFTYNPSTNTLTAGTFSGALSGNATSATSATSATNATNTGITDDTTTNATMYPTWVTTTTGNLPQKVSSTKLTFNPSTGALAATAFSGSGASLTSLNASNLSTGTVATARLGSGTADNSTFLRGDGTWAAAGGSSGPAFSAYPSGNQSITGGVGTKIICDVEEFDTNSNYDTTNSRFTPTVAGYYQVNGCVALGGPSPTGNFLVAINKNGAEFKRGIQAQAPLYSVNVSALIYLNGSTDYIEMFYYNNLSVTTNGAPQVVYFQAAMVRPA